MKMGRKTKCRLWWPCYLSSLTSPTFTSFLFGWFIPSSETSIDVVVAFARSEPELTSSISPRFGLQEILQGTNKNMPALLQDKSNFCLLGYCESDVSGHGESAKRENDKNSCINSTSDHFVSWGCGCSKHDGKFEQGRKAAVESIWICLVYGPFETTDGRVPAIPKLDHLHLNSEAMTHLDLHVCDTL